MPIDFLAFTSDRRISGRIMLADDRLSDMLNAVARLVIRDAQVEELNDVLHAELPDEEWDTVGGFVFGTLEHVPVRGESIVHDGWRFTAAEVEGRRIKRVRVSLQSSPPADGAQPAANEPAGRNEA